METGTIIEYTFDEKVIEDAEGVFPIILPQDAKIASGPGSAKSVHLGPSGGIQADISTVPCGDITKFHANIIFNLNEEFDGRQVLAECEKVPFTLELIGGGGSVRLVGSVCSVTVDWRSTESWHSNIRHGIWHSADLIYDGETLTLFLDQRVVAFHSFGAAGQLSIEPSARSILIGGQGTAAFNGKIASFKLSRNIPSELTSLANHLRTTPEWHITTKLEMFRNIYDLGNPLAPVKKMTHLESWWQNYTHGAVMYHSGTAFEIHGEILACYSHLPKSTKQDLGYLISDEQPTHSPPGRKSVFQGGAIYFSPSTGAHEVVGEIYHDFEGAGETQVWGFPLDEALPANGGLLQQFQKATWYFQYGAKHAHEVHGEILKSFVATGGLEKWGYPVSNEMVVHTNSLRRDVRRSEFENGSFYWSAATGAHAVAGNIRKKWMELGGAEMCFLQELGLPTTEEMEVPNADGAVMQGFEQGVIMCDGEDAAIVVYPFKLFLKSLKTEKSEEKENDVYFTAMVNKDEETLFCRRYPEDKAYPRAMEVEVGIELPTLLKPAPDETIMLTIDVWNHKEVGEHVHLGKWIQKLNASNAWGLAWNGKLEGRAGKALVLYLGRWRCFSSSFVYWIVYEWIGLLWVNDVYCTNPDFHIYVTNFHRAHSGNQVASSMDSGR
ncbi:hypothetical protein BCR34DRAFT_23908 [Clohesyomyces aquaticus]|uniref:Concanavalin A-like lectin/glucanase domain-containing protein n=1 Tax=Clohesyomyces aquaticus TaxID=1231657 RepID=A0A1Y2A6J6_9PLEO|nr:hypothetical protein BCR34DRAFT_23908 [Clohesyomyces aquaticus]